KRRITPYSPKLETRFYNKTISHTTAATTIAVNDVPAGTGSSDRTGRKVMCKSVEINIEATSSAAAGVRPDPVRVVLYSPKQSGDVWTP
ncbi:hypothetical protein, partial [Achromobacter pulmonis]|uniref:hypothetical protein n=1 Tax=Achromobacter pulmonis TaxID=1389932 RepID=UPI001C62ABE8